MDTSDLAIRRQRHTQLAGCLAAALVLACGTVDAAGERPSWWKRPDSADIALSWQPAPHALPAVPAGSVVVQNCDDHGSGSLRNALANASNGATIDLTQLSCSRITLTTGSLTFTQPEITLQGPGSKYLSISGNDIYSPLRHNAIGRLYVSGLAIEHGLQDGGYYDGKGGCIYGDQVYVDDSVLSYCMATTDNTNGRYGARGGAIYAFSSLRMRNSSVIDSEAVAGTEAYGGGIFSRGYAHIISSFISGNYSTFEGGGMIANDGLVASYTTFDSNNAVYCGGFCAVGDSALVNSTISNNQASVSVGAAEFYAPYDTAPVMIVSSTVSGNRSYYQGGVLIARGKAIYGGHIANSTIAFNHEDIPTRHGAGLALFGQTVNGFDLESNIIAGNTYGAGSNPDDVAGGTGVEIAGANNLIGYSMLPVPVDTILAQDPLLAPLAFNGGPTATHELLSGSPAIDAGNNSQGASFDQRGSGYPRVIGAAPDIGAYELGAGDEIFANGFDP